MFRYRPDLLSPQNLCSAEKIEDAIYELEQSLTRDHYAKVLQCVILHEDKGVLPLVLACKLLSEMFLWF